MGASRYKDECGLGGVSRAENVGCRIKAHWGWRTRKKDVIRGVSVEAKGGKEAGLTR